MSVFFLTNNINDNKIEKVRKFINVKLYGANPNIDSPPSKKGAKNITRNLLFINAVKLNLKSFSQLYSLQSNLCF